MGTWGLFADRWIRRIVPGPPQRILRRTQLGEHGVVQSRWRTANAERKSARSGAGFVLSVALAVVLGGLPPSQSQAAGQLSAGFQYVRLPQATTGANESGGATCFRFEYHIDEFWRWFAELGYSITIPTTSDVEVRHWLLMSSGMRYNLDIGMLSPFGEAFVLGLVTEGAGEAVADVGLGVGVGLEWTVLGPWSITADGRYVILPNSADNILTGIVISLRTGWYFQ